MLPPPSQKTKQLSDKVSKETPKDQSIDEEPVYKS